MSFSNFTNIKSLSAAGERASNDYQQILNLPTSQTKYRSKKPAPRLKFRDRTHETIEFDKSLLFQAALNDDVKTLETMNFTNDEINNCDSFGWSALMIAACEGSQNVCKFLLNQQCDVTIADRGGNTALSLATSKNRTEIIEMFREKMRNVKKTAKPLNETASQIPKLEPFWCEECQQMFKETKKSSHQTSTLHRFNHKNSFEFTRRYFIPDSNVGFKMMLKQGWDRETGLGPNNEGKLYPVKTTIRKARSGLGVKQDSARVTHFSAYDRDAIKWRPPAPKAKSKKQLERDATKNRRKEIALRKALS